MKSKIEKNESLCVQMLDFEVNAYKVLMTMLLDSTDATIKTEWKNKKFDELHQRCLRTQIAKDKFIKELARKYLPENNGAITVDFVADEVRCND